MNNLKAKVDDLDVAKLKTDPVDLKILSCVADHAVVKSIKFNTLKTNINNLEKNSSCNYFNSYKLIQHR